MASSPPAGRPKRTNLTISMSDELYDRLMEYKRTHKVSLSAIAREFMGNKVAEYERDERLKKEGRLPQ